MHRPLLQAWAVLLSTQSEIAVTDLYSVNIGNARLFGLEKDLKLEGGQFQLAVSVLFITYCVSETLTHLWHPLSSSYLDSC